MKRCKCCFRELLLSEFYTRAWGTDGKCKSCQKHAVARWREKNRDRHNENARRWRATHPEKVREINQRMYAANGSQYAIKNREWAKANRDKCRLAERRWRQKPESKAISATNSARWRSANPERAAAAERKWRQQHPDKIRQFAKTRRARKAGAPINDFTNAQWTAIQEAFGHRCAYCDRRCKGRLTQDHIQPLSKGGNHTASNIVPACGSCNSRKNIGAPLRPVQPKLLID